MAKMKKLCMYNTCRDPVGYFRKFSVPWTQAVNLKSIDETEKNVKI